MSEYVQTIKVRCPRCGSSSIVKRGYHYGKQTFACKDCERRFFQSNETLDGRAKQIGAASAAEVMRKARANSATVPKRIKTDRLRSYDEGVDAVFAGEAEHIKSDGITAAVNNNLSERLQGTFRERTKTMRGLQSRATGQRFLDGWVINYNVFRPHYGLKGKTPAQAAHVYPPFKEWEDLAKPRTRAFTTGNEFKARKGSF